jgi:hypothetical protein
MDFQWLQTELLGVQPLIFSDQLSINNYYLDALLSNLYIYGLYGKDGEFVNNVVTIFYIVKFDGKGNKIWQNRRNKR